MKQPLQLEELPSLKRKECPTPSNEDEFILNSVSNRLQSIHPAVKRKFIHNVRQQIVQSFQDEQRLFGDEINSDSFLGANDFIHHEHSVGHWKEEHLGAVIDSDRMIPIRTNESKKYKEAKSDAPLLFERRDDINDDNLKDLKMYSSNNIRNFSNSTFEEAEPKVSICKTSPLNSNNTFGQKIEMKNSTMEVDEVDIGGEENLFEVVTSPIITLQERKIKRFNLGVQSKTNKPLSIKLVL